MGQNSMIILLDAQKRVILYNFFINKQTKNLLGEKEVVGVMVKVIVSEVQVLCLANYYWNSENTV